MDHVPKKTNLKPTIHSCTWPRHITFASNATKQEKTRSHITLQQVG